MPGQVNNIMSSLGFTGGIGGGGMSGSPGIVGGANTTFEVFVRSLGIDPNNMSPEMRNQLMQMFLQMKQDQNARDQERRDSLEMPTGYSGVGARGRR